MKGCAMITREQAEQAVRERWNNIPIPPEIRNLVLEPINTDDIGSGGLPMVNDDLGVDLEEAGWLCTFEARYKETLLGEWTGRYGEWHKDTSYVVEAKPGPYVLD